MEQAPKQVIAREDGYRGIWYCNQAQQDEYKYKYSGGFATYPQQHIPIAVYSSAVNKTFFCFGGISEDGKQILNMVSYYDHATGQVPRPVVVLARSTFDAHYNPTLQIDESGYLTIFCNSHGVGGELDKSDPTYGQAYIYKSLLPYSIEGFERVYCSNFSYSQPWRVPDQGLLWLHTRYAGNVRRLFWANQKLDGEWSEPQPLAAMGSGGYQISWAEGKRVATAMDFHPELGGLNARSNIYYLESHDFGKTWRTVEGHTVETPLTEVSNAALVHDYHTSGTLVYLKDLQFDLHGHPVILYITSRGPWSGPQSGPRHWNIAHWTGERWTIKEFLPANHNYDHGSLYIEPDGTWRIIAPTASGPQDYGTGGEIEIFTSRDEGESWTRVETVTIANGRNQTYVRHPWHAHPDFYAFWADGNAFERSESNLYFATQAGRVYQLPTKMTAELEFPIRVL
jgi:hypothetical protein